MTDPRQVSIAMFGPTNDNGYPDADTDAHEYWGLDALRRNGPVVWMPPSCGINANYQGDATSAFVDSPESQRRGLFPMVTLGLCDPTTSLADAANPPDPNNDVMWGKWGDAMGKLRWAQNYGHASNPSNPYDWATMTSVRNTAWIRFGHEMTIPNQYAWCDDGSPGWAANFKAAFHRAVEVARAVMPVGNSVGIILNPNWDYATRGYDLSTLADPTDYDIVAIDIYDFPDYMGGRTNDVPNLSPQDRWSQFCLPALQAVDAFAASQSKYVGVCEFGAGDQGSGDNPYFYEQMAAWVAAATAPVAVMGVWNSTSGYNSQLTNYPNARQAFINGFAGA